MFYNSPAFTSQFESTIDDIGVWMIYTRSDHRFRCISCYDPTEGDSKPNCSTCFGTGYKVSIEKWLVHYSLSYVRLNADSSPLTPVGFIPNHTYFIFSKKDNIPVFGDIFFLVGWDRLREKVPEGGRPIRVDQALKIDSVIPHIAGNSIYYVAKCFTVDHIKSILEAQLHSASIVRTRS